MRFFFPFKGTLPKRSSCVDRNEGFGPELLFSGTRVPVSHLGTDAQAGRTAAWGKVPRRPREGDGSVSLAGARAARSVTATGMVTSEGGKVGARDSRLCAALGL